MAETITHPYATNGGNEDELASLFDDEVESQPKSRRARVAIGAGLSVILAASLGNAWWASRDSGSPNDRPKASGDRGVAVGIIPNEDPSTPAPRSGGFAKVILDCTGVTITRLGDGTYRYSPSVKLVAGELDSPDLYTVGVYLDESTGDNRTTAVRGVGAVTMNFRGNMPVGVGLIDFSQSSIRPSGPEAVPDAGSLAMIGETGAKIYPCPADDFSNPDSDAYAAAK